MENQWKELTVKKHHNTKILKEREKLWSALKLVNFIVLFEYLSGNVMVLNNIIKMSWFYVLPSCQAECSVELLGEFTHLSPFCSEKDWSLLAVAAL